MEIYTEVPSAATRAALRKLGQWLGSWSVAVLSCCTRSKNGRLQDHNQPSTWVGDTGIEPVTSSV